MREVQLSEATANLPDLLESVERGETIAIVRDGQRVARLVPEVVLRRIEVEKVFKELEKIRKRTGKVTVEEILEA